jgi:hypothetical protein
VTVTLVVSLVSGWLSSSQLGIASCSRVLDLYRRLWLLRAQPVPPTTYGCH